MRMNTIFKLIIPCFFTLFLIACGGGGGGTPAKTTLDCGGPDTDGDGLPDCYEKFLGTSIVDEDTDGDNLTDYDEVVTKAFDPDTNNFQFNPRIADVPQLSFELTSVPDISVNYTDTQEETISNTDTMSSETATTTTTSQTSTESVGVEVSGTSGIEFSLDNFGGSYSATVSESWEKSFSWTKSQSVENRRAHEKSVTATSSASVTQTGGEIALTLKVKNQGFQVVTLTNLSISALETDPRDATTVSVIGNLDFDTSFGSFPEIDIEPNKSTPAPLIFRRDLSLGKTLDLLKNSDNLILEAATWQAKDADGRSFTQNLTDIGAKDATVVIDFGPRAEKEDSRRKESYFVATTADFNNKRITVAEAMQDILKIPYTTGTAAWNGSPTQTHNGLLSVRGVGTDKDVRGHWTALYVFTTNNGADREAKIYDNLEEAYDFDNLELRKGYVLHLVYIEDVDGDGLGAREEFLHGTSDDDRDSDDDGRSDFDEIKTAFEIPLSTTITRKVFSDPLEADADDDLLNDADEFAKGTDPFHADTNGNGVKDNLEGILTAAEMFERTYLPLDGGLLDASGNGVHGSVNPLLTYGRDRSNVSQSALYLDGTTNASSQMSIPSVFSGEARTGIAWSFWIKPEVIRHQGVLAYAWDSIANGNPIGGNPAVAKFWMYDTGGTAGQSNPAKAPIGSGQSLMTLNDWVHVVGVVSDEDITPGAEKFSLYLNGVLIRSLSHDGVCCLTFGSEPWTFGVDQDDTPADIPDGLVTKRFNGYLDDIRFFGRSLSASEVNALYQE